MCSCHGKTPTELLGPSKPFPQVLCPLQKVNTKEKPSCEPCHCVFWQSGVWYTSNYISPGNPGGTSYFRKYTEQKSCLQNQVETLPTPVRSSGIHSGDLFTLFCEIQCNCSHKSGFTKFFFAIWQQRFCQARRFTSIVSGAEQDTCKSSSLFGNRDAVPSRLISQEEQFQNVFTGNCNEKINFYFPAPCLSVLLSCVSLLCRVRHSLDRCSWG